MKERPILFSAPMVRAILSGTKTQTRRVVKPQPDNDPALHHPIAPYHNGRGGWNWVLAATGHGTGDPFPCPYGAPGDRLWVRETWAYGIHALNARNAEREGPWVYGADSAAEQGRLCDRWRPSIHMRREASRLVLEITGVRVERLQDISEADAQAEGIFPHVRGGWHWLKHDSSNPDDWNQFGYKTAALAFQALWESINGPESWVANPWVWVVEFRCLEATR